MDYVWKSVVILLSAILLLKLAGRKSIAQMNLPQTIVMLSIGTILVQPVIQEKVLDDLLVIAVFIGMLIFLEYLQVKFNPIEAFIMGKSKVVIQDGTLCVSELKKLRMTVDQLEMRLRMSGISKMEDVKTATIEPNGQLGYELKDEAKPLTVRQFQEMMNMYFQKETEKPSSEHNANENIFREISGGGEQNPRYLE